MEGIFTLPYSEYEVINKLQKKLTKAEGNFFCNLLITSYSE